MEELLEVGQGLQLNPYVAQVEKLSESLQYLSQVFAKKSANQYTSSMVNREEIVSEVKLSICQQCEEHEQCGMVQRNQLQHMIDEVIKELEEYGSELSIRKRREWMKSCGQFEELKARVEKNYWKAKNQGLWEGRIAKSKEASIVIMQALVKAMEETTKEIDASTFQDEHLERKLCNQLRRIGIRPLKVMVFVSKQGTFEIQISSKAKQGVCVTTRQMADVVSMVLGRRFVPEKRERYVLQETYDTVIFVEKPRYQILYGIAKRTKLDSEMSGDNFQVLEGAGGKLYGLLSDGMGSGVSAYHASKIILELAEILLEASVPEHLAIEMINAVLITESREVEFATLDMCIVDRYRGKIELLKAGATSTYIVTSDSCAIYDAASLPIGVISELEINHYKRDVEQDCYVIMLTDGVTEAIPSKERESFMIKIIRESKTKNSKEIADNIIEKALKLQCHKAKDDMMVLVLGIWELQF